MSKDEYEATLAVIASRIANLAGLSGIPERAILQDLTIAECEARRRLTAKADRRTVGGETAPPSVVAPDGA
jgi:hypothetical protein